VLPQNWLALVLLLATDCKCRNTEADAGVRLSAPEIKGRVYEALTPEYGTSANGWACGEFDMQYKVSEMRPYFAFVADAGNGVIDIETCWKVMFPWHKHTPDGGGHAGLIDGYHSSGTVSHTDGRY
jgi:hypothetical protein